MSIGGTVTGYERIEKEVLSGRVLDDTGRWVPLAQKVAQEREFFDHLTRGEVLWDRQWAPIDKVKERRAASPGETKKISGATGAPALTVADVKKIVAAPGDGKSGSA
jgi:hypothetical protein